MKMTVPDILRNRFRGEEYPLGTFMGTPHGNGGGPHKYQRKQAVLFLCS